MQCNMVRELTNIPTEVLQLISADQAYHYRVIPYKQEGGKIYFKTDDYAPNDLLSELQIILGSEVVVERENKEEIEVSLQKNYRRRSRSVESTSLNYSEDFLLNMIYEAKEIGSSKPKGDLKQDDEN